MRPFQTWSETIRLKPVLLAQGLEHTAALKEQSANPLADKISYLLSTWQSKAHYFRVHVSFIEQYLSCFTTKKQPNLFSGTKIVDLPYVCCAGVLVL